MNRDFKINNFDFLRLFAAVEVLLIHSYPRLHLPFPAVVSLIMNFPGVSMFFVMSGFLISASLERNQNLKNYFRNRVLRIFPALWVCIILTIIVIYTVAHISFLNKEAIVWFVSQYVGLVYTPGFLKSFGFGTYNGSLWTIPLELQFYVVLPVLYFVVNKISTNERVKTLVILGVFIAFCLLTYGIKVYYDGSEFENTHVPAIVRYTFIPNVFLFLFGVVLQRFNVYSSNWVYGKGLYWVAGYALISYLVPTYNSTYILKLLCLGITTISLAYTLRTAANKILKGNDISYGVYIYHGLVLGVVVQLKLFGNPLYILVIAAITFVLATLSWNLIEKPFMRRKKKTIHNVVDVKPAY